MKSSYRFAIKDIDLNRSGVNFRDSLNLDIITPNSILSFPFHILFNIFSNIILKEFLFKLDIIHTSFPDYFMSILLTIELIGNAPKQTISIASTLLNNPPPPPQPLPQLPAPLLQQF